jgi:hypothetical protein
MNLSSIPYKFQYVWGASAGGSYINTIPATAGGAAVASQSLGFPPATALPTGSGGTPPSISDFNGALNYLSSWVQWQQAGGPIRYDGTFSTNVGGYPLGAFLQSTTGTYFWLNGANGNTTDPDGGSPLNWTKFTSGPSFTPVQQGGGTGQGTNKIYLGWDSGAAAMRVQVDSSDIGWLATQAYVSSAVATEVTNRNTAVAGEATARNNADNALQTNINNEATARNNADNALQTNINNEATARNNADALLYPQSGGVISGSVTIAGGPLEVSGVTGTSASGWQMNPSGTGSFSAGVTQSIHTSNDIVANRFIAASDGRVKSEIEPIKLEAALRFLMGCEPRTYIKGGQWDFGFIAQDVLAADWPQMVVMSDETLNAAGERVREPDERLQPSFNGFEGPAGQLLLLKESGVPAVLATILRHHVALIADLQAQVAALQGKA